MTLKKVYNQDLKLLGAKNLSRVSPCARNLDTPALNISRKMTALPAG
jgi:hypothetical protein